MRRGPPSGGPWRRPRRRRAAGVQPAADRRKGAKKGGGPSLLSHQTSKRPASIEDRRQWARGTPERRDDDPSCNQGESCMFRAKASTKNGGALPLQKPCVYEGPTKKVDGVEIGNMRRKRG